MQTIQTIQFYQDTREERLPGFAPEFPYIATRCEIGGDTYRFAPWHWHQAVELFVIQSGTLVYDTPARRLVFPPGSGGFVNSNVLHTTRPQQPGAPVLQQLHIFDPSLIAGAHGSRIEKDYVLPLLTAPGADLLRLDPADAAAAPLLARLQASFAIPEGPGYELRIRAALSELWLGLLALRPAPNTAPRPAADDKIKQMMRYIDEHYAEPIRTADLAAAAWLSERECFRVFREMLHTTPGAYLQQYRIRQACRLLAETQQPLGEIGYACGLGSASYFGKQFREVMGCTPSAYRAQMAGL